MKDGEDVGLIAGVGAILLVCVFIFVLANAPPARGHSWYPQDCCGGNDCAPVSQDRIRIVPGGYVLDGKYLIPEANARQSQDGDYHACFWPSPDKLHCFFKPPMGS